MADPVEETDRDSTEKEDLWSAILEDVSVSSDRGRKAALKNVLVLGDVCSGKSTLIDRLCQVSSKRSKRSSSSQSKYLLSGCSLEYRFIDVQDEETDDFLARLGVWNLDGVVWHSQLLPFVLHEKNIEDTLVMIVIDLTHPWNVLESLERWTQVVSKHVNSLKISEKQRRRMEDKMVQAFQSYIDPEIEPTSSGGDGEDVALPLEENVLTCNLGVPIIVVCTKSDCFSQLEKNEKYKDEHFDFIQQHIRRFCLNYGAALAYVSSKDQKNVEILYKYLVHRIYGIKFNIPASIVERDAIFIPSGWDSDKRIVVLCEQMKHINPREPLKNIINPPRATMPSYDVEGINSEDDQVFLLAQQSYLMKNPKPNTSGTPSVSTPTKDKSPRLPTANQQEPESKLPGAAAGTGGGGEQVLANFFNSLLTKKGTSKTSRTELEKLQQVKKGPKTADK